MRNGRSRGSAPSPLWSRKTCTWYSSAVGLTLPRDPWESRARAISVCCAPAIEKANSLFTSPRRPAPPASGWDWRQHVRLQSASLHTQPPLWPCTQIFTIKKAINCKRELYRPVGVYVSFYYIYCTNVCVCVREREAVRSTVLSYQWWSVYCSVVKIKAVEVKCGSLTWFTSAVCRSAFNVRCCIQHEGRRGRHGCSRQGK